MKILEYPLVLASQSPRRKELLTQLGYPFTVQVKPTSEQFEASMNPYKVPAYLAMQKANEFTEEQKQHLILCADTIVLLEGTILNKPQNAQEAYGMISQLSGKQHEVISAVCLAGPKGIDTVTDIAKVTFRELTHREIEHYIKEYRPFDKAGAYGIQEWIGMIGITKMEGSFYTIMGLPTHLVYQLLQPYQL
jgi:septum formation protein